MPYKNIHSLTKILRNNTKNNTGSNTGFSRKFRVTIFCGGVDFEDWDNLSVEQKQKALSYPWRLLYRHLNPVTGKMERQPDIYVSAKLSAAERHSELKDLERELLKLLDEGYSPYDEKPARISELLEMPNENILHSLKAGLEIKTPEVSETYAQDLRLQVENFTKFLKKNKLSKIAINDLNKRICHKYLDEIGKTSDSKRNNAIRNMSALFGTMQNALICKDNPWRGIKKTKINPVKNKRYTPEESEKLLSDIAQESPYLMMYIYFIILGTLRPIEVNRLKIKDISLKERTLKVQTKTGFKHKRIPELLAEQIEAFGFDFSKPEDLLFTKDYKQGTWHTGRERSKREFFSSLFQPFRLKHGFPSEYTMYSLRHTYFYRMYRNLRKEHDQYEAKLKMMPITGHATMQALEKYLRDIGADLPDDYSDLLS